MFKNKRGLSPLVATIILILFAVVLGVIILNWGRAQVVKAAKCPVDSGMKIVSLNGRPQLCYAGSGDTGYIEFYLENGVTVDIAGILLRVIGEKDLYQRELHTVIERGYTIKEVVPYNFNLFGKIKQIKMIPKIDTYPGEPPLICQEQALTISNIRVC